MNNCVFYGRDIADGCSVVMVCWCLPDSCCIELVCELRNPCGLKTIAHAGANVDWPALLANLALGLTMAISRNMCLVRSLLSSIRMDAPLMHAELGKSAHCCEWRIGQNLG